MSVHVVIEEVARTARGRLVALLAAATRDLQLAEDAVAAALETAVRTWPTDGVPDNPEGWLLTVARNRQRDTWRSAAHRTSVPLDAAPETGAYDDGPQEIPERRLALLFVCAHPAIDERARTPLMLQTVLGHDAAGIAGAFAVPTATMAQRLVRAKRRIRDARIPFVVPERATWLERVPAVLEAVYGAEAIGDDGEARYLAVTLARLLVDDPEAWALAALTTLRLSRRPDPDRYVPLDEQDPAHWDATLVAEGEAYLRRAGGGVGRFRLEAAIAAVHADRARTGVLDRSALRTLYDALLTVAPTLGARVARAAVVGELDGPAAGLAALPGGADGFQPYWATRAHLLTESGELDAAREAYDRALALTHDDAVRSFLLGRRPSQVPAGPPL